MYRPKRINQMRTAAELVKPTVKTYNGVSTKKYPKTGELIYINFRSKGGTESVVDGVYSILNTAEAVTWYREDITADCRIKIDNDIYEIKCDPEDVERQHLYMVLKLEKLGGGA